MELSRYFRISSRTHHGLVFVTELVRNTDGRPTSIRSVAHRMHLSEKYLEELARILREAGIVRSARGRSGGYVLTRAPGQVTVGEVVRLLDGPVVLAACQDQTAEQPCPAEGACVSRHFFGRLKTTIDRELDGMTLADLTGSEVQSAKPKAQNKF